MLHHEATKIITTYASEMLPLWADRFERWPQGGQAAMIANYLNDHAETYRKIAPDVCKQMIEVATEIIVRSDK